MHRSENSEILIEHLSQFEEFLLAEGNVPKAKGDYVSKIKSAAKRLNLSIGPANLASDHDVQKLMRDLEHKGFFADIDTGEQGTCTVYAVSLALDANHDTNMDLTFNGADSTSVAKPDQIWVNDNYDRWHDVDCTLGLDCDTVQDDLGAEEIASLPKYQEVPDCFYVDGSGQPAIPCPRDLEDYFRLWMPGLSFIMEAMPTNYSAQLTLTGNGQIRIFKAFESSGGTAYLFDPVTASNQVANSASLYIGLLSSSAPLILTGLGDIGEHFIFCGVTNGSARVDLQILDGNSHVVADAPAYLQINEIRQMYERWTVGDLLTIEPTNVPTLAGDDLPTNPPVEPFQYSIPQNTNTPYILLVHGWNMQPSEKDRFAETAYKRLYWQGYQGRFGLFRWPTGNGFSGIISAITDGRNYDNSESNAWASARGLTNLLTRLNSEYPSSVYLMAHSMGNVVAGEALRLAGSQFVNTYIGIQGAVPAHCYDSLTTTNSVRSVPDDYAQYWTSGATSYFHDSAGAGSYINFYNTNDYALGWWNVNQGNKPDIATEPAYHYVTPSGTHPSGFYKQFGSFEFDVYFPTNTYELFAYAVPSWGFALGAQANVGGVFETGSQTALQSVWPSDPISPFDYSAHYWHSAEFRGDNTQQANFWKTILGVKGFNLK